LFFAVALIKLETEEQGRKEIAVKRAETSTYTFSLDPSELMSRTAKKFQKTVTSDEQDEVFKSSLVTCRYLEKLRLKR
jgi:hypothetical protein